MQVFHPKKQTERLRPVCSYMQRPAGDTSEMYRSHAVNFHGRTFHKCVNFQILTAALEASALCLLTVVCMSSGDTDVARAASFLTIKLTFGCITGYIRVLLRLTHLVCRTSAASRRKASAACLGRHLRLHTFYMDILSSTAVILVVRTVYNITIQFCHLTYLLISSDFHRTFSGLIHLHIWIPTLICVI